MTPAASLSRKSPAELIETLAESTCDGIVAPLCYLVVGGVPAALAYKAINTLDSMIGHREPPYTYFGRCAARLDDVANFIPARFAALAIVLAAAVTGDDRQGRPARVAARPRPSRQSQRRDIPKRRWPAHSASHLGGRISTTACRRKPLLGAGAAARDDRALRARHVGSSLRRSCVDAVHRGRAGDADASALGGCPRRTAATSTRSPANYGIPSDA